MSDHPDSGPVDQPEPLPPIVESQEAQPIPLLLRAQQWMRGGPHLGNSPGYRWFRRGLVLVLLIAVGFILRQGVAYVGETQVGVRVNNLTGELQLRDRVGYHIYPPFTSQFYVLDKTIQRLDLGWRQGAPGSAGRDLKLKTADGSNVSLDVIINFKLIPQKAAEVLRHSGPGMRFADVWLEPFVRQVCFSTFGQLATEEMYDATKRNDKAQQALQELNLQLSPHGIQVITVIPGEFRFYKEYEEVIQQKKLADQRVQEQQAQARAAQQDQERQLVEARKKAESQLASFQGECSNRLIQSKAEAEKMKREADGKYAAALLNADAGFYAATKQAEGEKITLLAQAEGMEHMRRAMTGDGGVSMIGMEYAKHLGAIKFSATPIAREPSVHQFAMDSGLVAGVNTPVQPVSIPAPAAALHSSAPNTGLPGRSNPVAAGIQGTPEGAIR